MGDGSFVIRREGECNFFADEGCAVAPDTFELTPELEAERRASSENRLAMIGARSVSIAMLRSPRSACLRLTLHEPACCSCATGSCCQTAGPSLAPASALTLAIRVPGRWPPQGSAEDHADFTMSAECCACSARSCICAQPASRRQSETTLSPVTRSGRRPRGCWRCCRITSSGTRPSIHARCAIMFLVARSAVILALMGVA